MVVRSAEVIHNEPKERQLEGRQHLNLGTGLAGGLQGSDQQLGEERVGALYHRSGLSEVIIQHCIFHAESPPECKLCKCLDGSRMTLGQEAVGGQFPRRQR